MLDAQEVCAYVGRMNKQSAILRKATNVSLDADMVAEAKALGVNVSRACEAGLARELSARRRSDWLAESASAIESSNEYVRNHGLPLAKHRRF